MKKATTDILCCPICKSNLDFRGNNASEEITRGVFECKACRRSYPVEDGFIHFLQEGEVRRFSNRAEFFRSIYCKLYTPLTNFMFLPCGGVKKARQEVLERLEIPSGAEILETGIGACDNIPLIARRSDYGSFYGLDNQQKMLRKCMRNLKKWNIQADLFWSNAEEVPFKDDVFDVVFHLGAINLFSDKKQAIDEMIRVAKPKTRIVIADENEKAARLFSIFMGKQEKVTPPVDLIPDNMEDIHLHTIWSGLGYLIEFRTP